MTAILGGCAKQSPRMDIAASNATVSADEIASGDVQTLDPELNVDPTTGPADLTKAEQTALEASCGINFDLDPRETKEVERYFTYFTHKARKTFARWLKRSEPYLPYVRKVFTQRGIPQDIVLLPFAESGYNPRVYSHAGAGGMWQFMPATGRRYGLTVDWWIDERRDPYLATEAAADYLLTLYDMFGDWYLALAAYNAGEGKILRAMKITNSKDFFELSKKNHKIRSYKRRLRSETKNYVPKFIAIAKIFKNHEELGFDTISWNEAPELAHAQVAGGTDLLALAKAAKMSWKEFHDLNPAYRRQVSPPKKVSTIHFPKAKTEAVMAYLSSPGSRPYAGYKRHKIRSGDSWWKISRKYGVPIAILKQMNNRRSNTLRPGQVVMVPGRGTTKMVASSSSSAKKRRIAQSRANYRVQKGDNLWSISRAYNVSVNTIAKANGISKRSTLKIGQKLFIPDASNSKTKRSMAAADKTNSQLVKYVVRSGDNLWSIARRFGVNASSIQKWNKLTKNHVLHPGDKLKVYVR
ncbi:MAG: LysM peptidoglycan-binding domain-containing protein [Desulfovibrio sp.]